MNIALTDGNAVLKVGNYRSLFPQTSFNGNGPSDAFLTEHNALRVKDFRPHNTATEKLVACDPIIEDGWVYTVAIEPLTTEEIQARAAAQWAKIRAERNIKLSQCDWTQLQDAPVDAAAWVAYRQALRDITLQSDPFAITWPSAPGQASPGAQ